MRGWPSRELGDVGVSVLDCEHKTPPALESGHPYIAIPDLRDGRIDFSSARKISDDALVEWTRRTKPQRGDIVVTRRGRVGDTAPILSDIDCAIGQNLVILRSDETQVDQGYLRWASRGRLWAQEVDRLMNVGAVFSSLNVRDISRLRIPVPPPLEQRAIAATLDALDDKIESNRRASEIALKLAAAGLSTGTDRVRVGDVATVAKGLSYKGAGLDDGSSHNARPMLNLGSFTKTGALNWSGMKYYTGDFKPKHELSPWDLVIANTDLTQAREFIGRGVLVPEALGGALHSHHTTRVSFTDQPDLALVLWAQAETPEFRARAMGFASGTTVASLPAEAVLDYEMLLPSDTENSIMRARELIEMAWQKHAESSRLATLRDTLLPDLLSGRVRAPMVHGARLGFGPVV